MRSTSAALALPPPPPPPAIPLRYYQREAIDATITGFWNGKQRVVVSMPTGSGKSRMAIALFAQFLGTSDFGLFLAPTIDLVEQTTRAFRQWFPSPYVGRVQAEYHEVGRPITVASKDTLDDEWRLESILKAQRGRKCALIVIDECHTKVLSESQRRIIERLLAPHGLLLGLSATPYRNDRQSLVKVFPDGLVYYADYYDLMVQGYLARIDRYPIVVRRNEEPLAINEEGDIIKDPSSSLRKKLQQTLEYEQGFAVWNKVAQGKRTLFFGEDINDCYEFQRFLEGKGYEGRVIVANTPGEERRDAYARFAQGELLFLISYNVLTTGIDIPEVQCIILHRETNKGTWTQITGRGSRLAEDIGKTSCVLIEIGENAHVLTSPDELIGDTIEHPHSPSSLRRQLLHALDEADGEETLDDGDTGEEEHPAMSEEEREQYRYSIAIRLERLRVKATNIFTGDGWEHDSILGDFSRDCGRFGTFKAERDFTGYLVYHTSTSGRKTRLSGEVLDAPCACMHAQKYLEYLVERERKERGESAALDTPLTKGQYQHLKNRRVPMPPSGEGMKQRDYYIIKAFLDKWGRAFNTPEGSIGFFRGQGVKTFGKRVPEEEWKVATSSSSSSPSTTKGRKRTTTTTTTAQAAHHHHDGDDSKKKKKGA